MDVPEFQRLRRIGQLGTVHYIYPGANHTRFEHSLGVMHLAGKLVDQLSTIVDIPNRTKQLVQLAGMYHDIGHFAFSHLFDTALKMLADRSDIADIFKLHDHEERSIFFISDVNKRLQLLTPDEEKFVIDLITGHVADPSKTYLYQIVCNKECGIDVDKMDYLHRDAHHTGFPGFQSDYIILNARIDTDSHIAFRRKTYNDIGDLFNTRFKMHVNVYQHHTSREINKIYFCMMKRLGTRLFQFGSQTDDYNIESLMRTSSECVDLVTALDQRKLSHDCEMCHEFSTNLKVVSSGAIESVRFVN
jgi:HD superfamily phosphohydrolase